MLLRAAPGNPAQLQAGLNATPKIVAVISHQLGLDRPLYVQYWIWISGIVHLNFGISYATGERVTTLLSPRIPVTLELGVVSMIFTILVGVPLGVLSALKKDRPADHLTRLGSLISIAVPNFVAALFMVLLFGWWFRGVLPYQGFIPLSRSIGSNLSHILLPSICLALGPIGIVISATRTSMIEVLGNEYIDAARALGVSTAEIIWKDALRNALLPILTVLGLIAGYVISGAVVVETIFNLPGLGSLLVHSFDQRDYTVTITVMMIGAVTFVVTNLVVDLLYGFANPKVRSGMSLARS